MSGPSFEEGPDMIEISDGYMIVIVIREIVATAR
jgi:hypothetical protein